MFSVKNIFALGLCMYILNMCDGNDQIKLFLQHPLHSNTLLICIFLVHS